MNALQKLLAYLSYCRKANGIHAAQSKFIYNFLQAVFYDHNPYPDFELIEHARKQMLCNAARINGKSIGATPGKDLGSVSQLVSRTAKPQKYGRLLYNLMQYVAPATVVELGTGAGISTFYLAAARPLASVITIEGVKEIQQIAIEYAHRLSLHNITFIHNDFDIALPKLMQETRTVDLAFIDGNHTCKATLHYFDLLLSKKNEKSIFVFDDINWSKDMQQSWKIIKAHEQVTLCIECFQMGMVFFDKALSKQVFTVRY
ncbi:MAG: class I SAM-dependent methyltransferase [Bacteroidetes bacterium]|nr:class I SAM-dependent methyltransferase [Bacteroidota bacterium]